MSGGVGNILGAVVGLVGNMASLKAQKKAIRAQEKQAALADSRERRKLLRQAQIVQGSATNVAASIGGLGSSGLIGGVSNVTNQAQSQIGYQQTSLQLQKDYNRFMQQSANAQMWGGFGQSLFGSMDFGSVGPTTGGSYGYRMPGTV